MPTNLSSFFLFAAMTLVAVPSAFAQVTTFNVDMSCAPEDWTEVFVTGPWCGWCSNDVYNTMTDPDGDGIYSLTLDETVTGIIASTYALDGCTGQEDLVNDMIDGASCAPVTDFNGYANRQTPQGSTTNDYYGTCDGACNDYPPASVTFHVDMSGYEGPYDPSQVTWNGPANGWCGNCYPMADLDGDGIYSITLELEGDSIEYKFAIGAWYDEEDLEPESSCTRTTYDQGALNGCCFVNRVVSLLGEESIDCRWCVGMRHGCGPEFTSGCTNESACNYDADATQDDGSCFECLCNADFVFPGDVTFGPADPANGETFAVGYLGEFYADILHILVPTSADDFSGVPVPIDSLVVQDISLIGESGESLLISDVGIELTPNNNGDSGNPNAFLGGSQYCATLTGTPDTTGFFLASIDVVAWVASVFTGPISQEVSFEGYTLNLCSSQCLGCTDVAACNYEEVATLDDGSCEYVSCIEESPGCTDVAACNYEALATMDDGSCEYESCIEGNVLFYESFSNGFDGSNGNGAWTVNDNQDGRLWVWVAPDGQGFYPDGEATGSNHPGRLQHRHWTFEVDHCRRWLKITTTISGMEERLMQTTP